MSEGEVCLHVNQYQGTFVAWLACIIYATTLSVHKRVYSSQIMVESSYLPPLDGSTLLLLGHIVLYVLLLEHLRATTSTGLMLAHVVNIYCKEKNTWPC